MKNIFYFNNLNKIGGTESFLYYLSKKYRKKDITIYYKDGDVNQINRIREYARVKKYDGETIVCEKAYFNYKPEIIDNVEAKEYIQILHLDYKDQIEKGYRGAFEIHPKITRWIAVSKTVAKGFYELTGIKADVIYNPYVKEENIKKTLIFVSATRFTKDKGKGNYIKFAKILDEHNVDYLWFIFTNDTEVIENKNIVWKEPQLNLSGYMQMADYIVTLSSVEEAFGYTPVEALSYGTPVITTEQKVNKEIGLINGVNGYIVPKDLSFIPIKDICENKLKFTYEPPKDTWDKELADGESTYEKDKKRRFKVRATGEYKRLKVSDAVFGKQLEEGFEFEADYMRCDTLLGNNKKKAKYIEILEEIK